MIFGIHAKKNEDQMAEAKDKSHNKMIDLKSKNWLSTAAQEKVEINCKKATRVLKSLTNQEPFHSKVRFTIQLYNK